MGCAASRMTFRAGTTKDLSLQIRKLPATGNKLRLAVATFAELQGKVVLVNFWATWCPPCRKDMPDPEALYERFNSKGLVVLGISDEEAAKVEPFIRERKASFPVFSIPVGR